MDQKGRKCCNPFKTNHSKFSKLHNVTEALINSAKERGVKIKLGEFLCDLCHKRVRRPVKKRDMSTSASASASSSQTIASASSNQPKQTMPMDIDSDELDATIGPKTTSESSKESDSDENIELLNIDSDKVKKTLNELLPLLNMSGIDEAKLRGKKYQIEIMDKLTTRLSRVLFPEAKSFYESEIVHQLKAKFDETTNRNMKTKILSVFPKNWSVSKYREVLGENITKHMVYRTKELVEKNGILCDTTKKIGSKSIDQNTIDKVHEFYRSENISRACPGIREYIRQKTDGNCEKIQRRLILMNLNEAFEIFKSENPGLKIGFSKFASVRPNECVLASSAHGIHTTCVCVYHQNVKLIFDSLKSQFDLKAYNIETYRNMMEILLCETVTEKCRLNECEQCPGIYGKDGKSGLQCMLFQIIDESVFEKISFKQWINVGSKCK